MRINIFLTATIISGYCLLSCNPLKDLVVTKYTANNPVTISDVIFSGISDTVLISRTNGVVEEVINGQQDRRKIATLGLEIAALALRNNMQDMAVSTLEDGIRVLHRKSGKVLAKMPISTWCNRLFFSENGDYLVAYDQKGLCHIWDATQDYAPIDHPASMPSGAIVRISSENFVHLISGDSYVIWDWNNNAMISSTPIIMRKYAGTDGQGSFLSIDFNTCSIYNANQKATSVTLQHPNWPLKDPTDPETVYDIPMNLEILSATFAGNHVYTSGLDRTVRVWNKTNGELESTFNQHWGTVHKVKTSPNGLQVVSIDLKGGVFFHSSL